MDQADVPTRDDLVAVPAEQLQAPSGDISLIQDVAIDESSIDDVIAKQGDKPNAKKRQVRVKRRGHKYQSHDLIREISPKPDNQMILINKLGRNLTDSTKSTSTNNQETSLNQPDSADDQQKTTPAGDQPATELKPDAPISSSGKRNVQCNLCQRYMTESRLANHIRLLHVEIYDKSDENSSTKRKEFRCEYCGKSYAKKYTYEQHLRTHTEGRPKCPECGATFASAFSLFRHRAKSHNIEHNYTTHACDQCEKIFFSSSELALHKQRHSSEKIHVCLECKKAFSAKGNLQIHMRTHAKEKLYKCDICDNSFSHPYSLVSHRRIHTNEFPFTCPECGKSYRSKHQLTSHKNVHSDNRPYQCDQCEKTFRSRTAFKMHQDQHNGIKRFVCKFCDRKFQCHANKAKHERRHLGIKRFKCDVCDKSFIERQELRNHQKVHERIVSKSKEVKKGDTKRTRRKNDAHADEDMASSIEVSSS